MIHGCIDAYIEDTSNTTIDLQELDCKGHAAIQAVNYDSDISITDDSNTEYIIKEINNTAYIQIESVASADITLNWVCGVNYSVNYLKVTPTETVWITIDYGIEYNVRSNTDWIVS